MIMLLRKDKFGSSSEKTPKNAIPGQLSLFNEPETCSDTSVTEPITRDVKGYKRVNCKAKREELIKDLPVREVPCELPDAELFCYPPVYDRKKKLAVC